MGGLDRAQRKLKKRARVSSAKARDVTRVIDAGRARRASRARREATVMVQMGPLEKKNIDTDVSAAVAASPPGWANLGSNDDVARPTVCLNACQAGALATNRIGRRIRMTSLFMRVNGWIPSAMTGQAFLRMVIVYDKECNTAAPTSANLLSPTTQTGMAVLGNGKRFKIIADIVHPVAYSSDTQEGFLFDRYIKLNHDVTYIDGAGAGTFADIVSGGLFLIGWWGGSMSAGGAPTIKANFRVRYSDN